MNIDVMAFYYDERSVNLNRNTGWERYARMLRACLGDRVEGFSGSMGGPARKLIADWSSVPIRLLRNSSDVYHFPTLPPVGALNSRDSMDAPRSNVVVL